MIERLSARVIAIIVAAALAVLVVWAAFHFWQKSRSQGAQARVEHEQTQALSNSANDAVATVARSGEAGPSMPEAFSAWVLYDDSCGFCRRWGPFWKDTLARRGIGIAPLQSDWALARLGLSPEEASQDLRLIDERGADTNLVTGGKLLQIALGAFGDANAAWAVIHSTAHDGRHPMGGRGRG